MAKARTTKSDWTGKLAWLYVIAGTIAMIASLLLSIEVFNRLKNPGYVPACNLNPVLSCTNVADSAQSHLFGFPNYFIGIGSFMAIAVLGLALMAGGRFKAWFWRLVQLGVTFAFAFITWLQFESLYRIGSLCLFCMVVWTMTGPIFWYTTLYNLREGHIPTPKRLQGVIDFAQRYHLEILISWYLLIVALVLKRFWYYWSSLI